MNWYKTLSLGWYALLLLSIVVSVAEGISEQGQHAGLHAPMAALFTAAAAMSRALRIGAIPPFWSGILVGLGTVATAYLWLISETGSTFPITELPSELLAQFSLVAVAVVYAIFAIWWLTISDKTARAREEGASPPRERIAFCLVAPVAFVLVTIAITLFTNLGQPTA